MKCSQDAFELMKKKKLRRESHFNSSGGCETNIVNIMMLTHVSRVRSFVVHKTQFSRLWDI